MKIYCLQIILDILRHPIEYAKVLIQIGYEPLPPEKTTTLFGEQVLAYPNVFTYVYHIKEVDGVSGCYKGLWLKVLGNLISAVTTDTLTQNLNNNKSRDDNDQFCPNYTKEMFYQELKNDIIVLIVAIIISEPFHLITVRKMCQFVGKETIYNHFFGSIREVYVRSGVLGFYAGVMPRLIGDLLSLIFTSFIAYFINKYVLTASSLQKYTKSVVNVAIESVMYPFKVVAKCMSITNSGLAAGSPPHMYHYTNWIMCWVDLSQEGQLKRGASMFFRYVKEIQ